MIPLKFTSFGNKILLGKFFIPRKKEPFFETGGKVSATNRSQMSGNPV
jgi:hypothetical protein